MCDSTNLNMSPLCDMENHQDPKKWALDVKTLYPAGDRPDYVRYLDTPTRSRYYTQERRDEELLKTLTKVL